VDVRASVLGEGPLQLLLVRSAKEFAQANAQLTLAAEPRGYRIISRRAAWCGDERGQRARASVVQGSQAERSGAVGSPGAKGRERSGDRVAVLGGETLDDGRSKLEIADQGRGGEQADDRSACLCEGLQRIARQRR